MPKSKNRKEHKKKVASRLAKRKEIRNQKINHLKRIIEENRLKQQLQEQGIAEEE